MGAVYYMFFFYRLYELFLRQMLHEMGFILRMKLRQVDIGRIMIRVSQFLFGVARIFVFQQYIFSDVIFVQGYPPGVQEEPLPPEVVEGNAGLMEGLFMCYLGCIIYVCLSVIFGCW
jgi:hypothetical protein